METAARRIVVSICGPAGSGKSQLAKALAERLGPDRCARVPTDYYLIPAEGSREDYLSRPLAYDWTLLARVLALPEGTATSTPDFDFETFHRLAETGGRPFRLCPVMVIDAMEPYPHGDARLLIAAPADLRRARIVARDAVWQTRVRDRWQHLEATWAQVQARTPVYDLELDGTKTIETNAQHVAAWLEQRFGAGLK